MQILKEELRNLIQSSQYKDELRNKLEDGNFEYIFVTLVHEGILSYERYRKLRAEYNERNKYLSIISITSPRAFGETWAQRHIRELCPEIEKTTDSGGEYDVHYEPESGKRVKIEVKAGRAVDRERHNVPYHERALTTEDPSGRFDMNFQQMKPSCFDAVIMIGVWADEIKYWILTSEEVKNHPAFSAGQHRGQMGYEGQLHIKSETIENFEDYRVDADGIMDRIRGIYDGKFAQG